MLHAGKVEDLRDDSGEPFPFARQHRAVSAHLSLIRHDAVRQVLSCG